MCDSGDGGGRFRLLALGAIRRRFCDSICRGGGLDLSFSIQVREHLDSSVGLDVGHVGGLGCGDGGIPLVLAEVGGGSVE